MQAEPVDVHEVEDTDMIVSSHMDSPQGDVSNNDMYATQASYSLTVQLDK